MTTTLVFALALTVLCALLLWLVVGSVARVHVHATGSSSVDAGSPWQAEARAQYGFVRLAVAWHEELASFGFRLAIFGLVLWRKNLSLSALADLWNTEKEPRAPSRWQLKLPWFDLAKTAFNARHLLRLNHLGLHLRYGFEDAGSTGLLCGRLWALNGVLPRAFEIQHEPVFDHKIFEGGLRFNAEIYLVKVFAVFGWLLLRRATFLGTKKKHKDSVEGLR